MTSDSRGRLSLQICGRSSRVRSRKCRCDLIVTLGRRGADPYRFVGICFKDNFSSSVGIRRHLPRWGRLRKSDTFGNSRTNI